MAKTKISEFSSTPANNTDIDSINLAEGMAPSLVNDAIRELMAQLKDFQTGAVGDSFNGPIGTSTAAAGAFTTLSASSTATLSGLTASTALALDASKNVVSVTNTGTGSNVLATSPTLVTPILGTPTSATLTNATGLPIATGVSGLGTNVATFLATPSSANLRSALTDETGTGSAVFATSPTLVTPLLGTPTSGVATNLTGLPLTTGVTGTLPTANGGTNLTSFTSGGVVYASSTSALATGSAFQFNGTDLGLGVTPSVNTVSGSGYRQIEVGTSIGNMIFAGGNEMLVVQNAIYNSGFKYAQSTQASYFRLNAGQHQFFTAPSGTAGNAITFTQAMTLTAAGNLGIGSTSPDSYRLKTVGAGFVFTGTNYFNVGIHDGSAAQRGVAFGYDSGSQTGIIAAETAGAASNLAFYTFNGSAWGERAKINSFGVGLGGATPSSGTGITFPATQSASTNANTLDDYEEGTWTPTNTQGVSMTVNSATYTKIGRSVFITFDLTVASNANTNQLAINLPFSASANSAGSIGYTENTVGQRITSDTGGVFYVYSAANAIQTCASYSGLRFWGSLTYPTST